MRSPNILETSIHNFDKHELTVKHSVKTRQPLISVIVCAHNEEEYVDKSLPKLIKALHSFNHEIIFIADRCTDDTVERAKRYGVKIIEKKWSTWEYSYAESLQSGFREVKGTYVGILDVDIAVSPNFFRDTLLSFKGNTASVAANVITYPDTFMNRIMYAWERTRRTAPLGREPYGAARLVLKEALQKIGGFRDVPTPDTDIDIRLENSGYKSVAIDSVKVYHVRQITLRTIVNGQINSGRGRYVLKLGFLRTFGHAFFRIRPFTICGWLLEWQREHLKHSD